VSKKKLRQKIPEENEENLTFFN